MAIVVFAIFSLSAAPARAQFALPAAPGAAPPIEQMTPREAPRVAPGMVAPPIAPRAPSTATARFPIREVVVEGVTAYPPAEIARLTEGLTGSAVEQSRIDDARAAIIDRYRRDGYVYTVANAVIARDTLRFVVTEGRISKVKLDGDIGPAGTQVLRFLNNLTEHQGPIDVATLERWLLLAAEVPGVTLRSTLAPSTEEPGSLTLIAQVSRAAVNGLITSDNRAFPLTGPEQALAVFDFNSFTEYGERTEISLYRAYNGTQIFGQASSEVYLGASGLKLKIYGGAGDALPSGSLRTIGYDGTTSVFGVQVSYPLIRVRQQSLNLIGNFDGLESQITTTLGPAGSRIRASYDSLRILRAGMDYAQLDLLFGPDMSAVDQGKLRLSQGLLGLGAAPNGSPDAPRLGQQNNFTKLGAEISRNQSLFSPWENSSVGLLVSMAGQVTNDILPLSEKYYLGGPHFNRGYYWGQVTGDNAVTASAELQLNTPIPLPQQVPFDVTAQFYAFYDWGQVWQNQTRDPNQTLRSLGGGVRLFMTKYVEMDFEGAMRLNRYPNGSGPSISPLNSGIFYWMVLARF